MFLTKKRKALLFLGLVILLMVFPVMLVNHRMEETDYCVEKDCPDLMSPSKVSGTIMINGNLGWIDFRNAGNCTGSGTDIDPYVIEDLIIDGQGSEPCILIGNSDVYFRIENCSLFNALNISEYSGYLSGIVLYNVTNGYIKQVNCSFNNNGIFTINTDITISQCILSNNLYFGWFGGSLSGNQNISENIIINNGGGIGMQECNNSLVSANTIEFNIFRGLDLYRCINISFSDNLVNNNNGTGIQMADSNLNIIHNNLVNNNNGKGIYMIMSDSNIISDNEINNNKLFGIEFILSSDENRIVNNMINENSRGIFINDWNENNRITSNRIINNREIGIEVNRTEYHVISNNIINGGYYGIKLFESNHIEILHNTINNHEHGIYLTSSHINEIIGNTLHYNGACITESNWCSGNVYEDNSCIEGIFAEWVIPVVVTVVSLVALAVLIYLLARHKKSN